MRAAESPDPETAPQLPPESRVPTDMMAVASLEPDAELMVRVRDGDSTCFAVLLERYRRPVVNFLYRMVQNRAVAEELAQEVFLRVYRSRESYQPAAKFTTWLFRIATNLALNNLRDGKSEKNHEAIEPDGADRPTLQLLDANPTPEQRLIEDVRVREVRAAIAALPAKQRAAVLMHKYQELEYAQIAGALECSESAVKSLLFRAYESLRARLAHLA
jgi:RNA polymerase sigma-70 factor, ECF subfamily